jgi:hypothetical protein
LIKPWRCAHSNFRVPELDAATAANDHGLLPADMAAHGGTFSQNKSFQISEVSCFEVGLISLIRPWRYASSKFRVPDCIAATTTNNDVPLPADMAACVGTCSQNKSF